MCLVHSVHYDDAINMGLCWLFPNRINDYSWTGPSTTISRWTDSEFRVSSVTEAPGGCTLKSPAAYVYDEQGR